MASPHAVKPIALNQTNALLAVVSTPRMKNIANATSNATVMKHALKRRPANSELVAKQLAFLEEFIHHFCLVMEACKL